MNFFLIFSLATRAMNMPVTFACQAFSLRTNGVCRPNESSRMTRSLMPLSAFFVFCVLVGVGGAAEPKTSLDRQSSDRAAKEAFLKYYLFANGRGMHTMPGVFDEYERYRRSNVWQGRLLRHILRDQMGMTLMDDQRAVGLFATSHRDVKVGAFGCVACHCGKVDGRIVPGLGNKNIDPYMMAKFGKMLQIAYRAITPIEESDTFKRLTEQSFHFISQVSRPDTANQTQGLVSNSAMWAWFFQNAKHPRPEQLTPAATKVPALWGFEEKRQVGLFFDGLGATDQSVGWVAMTELVAGQTATNAKAYVKRWVEVEELFGDLLPPKYLRVIDQELANRGSGVFQDNCRRCHGSYERDEHGLPLFQPPKKISIDIVDTDRDRLNFSVERLDAAIEASEMADLIGLNPDYRPGYYAHRLEGIWARFPYLHNASVPSLAALLTPPEERPMFFDLHGAGEAERFNERIVGLDAPPRDSIAEQRLKDRADDGARDVYDVRRLGQSNRGHSFGTGLPDKDKQALIEYLKTL